MTYNNYLGEEENIKPEAAGLYSSISNQGYSNSAAIADLIDNSIDAGADTVWLTIDNSLKTIRIADDGCGMSMEELNRALRLGGKKEHAGNSELGKFGMGLISASLSMGPLIKIITKHDGKYSTGITDQDEIVRRNVFNGRFYESTQSEIGFFNEQTDGAENGTILIIDKCDNIQYKNASDLIDKLMNFIGEVFRAFICKGKKIYINDELVRINDPLMLDNPNTTIIYNNDIEVSLPDGTTDTIHLLAAKLPDLGQARNRKVGLNIANQGFYVMRNNREIAKALEFGGVFMKHNDLNLLRIELSFNSTLDKWMGVNSRKQDINPKAEIEYYLKNALRDPIDSLRREMKAKQKAGSEKKNPFKEKETGNAVSVLASTSVPTVLVSSLTQQSLAEKKEYDYVSMSFAGSSDDPLFKVSVLSNRITIRLNINHPYYSEKILEVNNVELKVALNKVILASIRAFVDACGVAKISFFAEVFAREFEKTES